MIIPDEYRGKTVRVVLQSSGGPGTHPFHMHGHGFQVVADGVGPFNDAALALTNSVDLRDAVVRDTLTVPANGWIVVQYVFPPMPYDIQRILTRWFLLGSITADNPGVWALHCHVGELLKPTISP